MKIPQSGLRLDNPAWPLLQALISYSGITSGAGAASGLTLVCADLVNEPSYDGLLCKIKSGAAAGQVKPIYVQAGTTLTFATPWTNAAGAVVQITGSTLFDILSISGGGGGPGPSPEESLSYYGVVDAAAAPTFTIGALAGLGAGKFADLVNPYWAFVLRDAGGLSAAPQGELMAITAYNTATGVFTTGAFTAAIAVGDEILIVSPAIAAMIPGGGGVMPIGYPDGLHFNDTEGVAGVAWPTGTAQQPSNDEASILAIAVAAQALGWDARKISIYGRAAAFVVPSALVGYELIGHGRYSAMDTINMNGQDVSTSSFRWLNIIGAMGGVGLSNWYDCYMVSPTNINGTLWRCLIQQMSLMAGATIDAYHCGALQGAATITLGTPAPCNLYGWKGGLVLAGQTGGTTNVYAEGGLITVNVSCNGGIINIYGTAIVVDNSAVGCTVNDLTENDVPIADVATNVQARDVIGNKSDAAVVVIGVVASIMAYIKGILLGIAAASHAFQEQADTAVNINAILASETDVFDLNVAGTRYIIRNLRLKCANPGADTVTVRLRELVNNVSTIVATFDITAANFATYFSLMDMFGVQYLAGDDLQVTVQASAAGPYAVTGQYSHATAT